MLAKRRAATVGAGTSTPANPPSSATSTPNASEPAPVDNRQKGVVAIAGSEDKDTCTGLVFKMPRVGDVKATTHSTSDGHAPSFHDNPPSASSPRDLVVHEGRGRVPLKAINRLPLLSSLLFSKKPSNASRPGDGGELGGQPPLRPRGRRPWRLPCCVQPCSQQGTRRISLEG